MADNITGGEGSGGKRKNRNMGRSEWRYVAWGITYVIEPSG
jgi:hypothetical protein